MTEHITENKNNYDKVLTLVHAYRAEVYCKCGGELRSTGSYNPTSPPKCPHICQDCGMRVTLNSMYPKMEYR